MTLSDFLDLAKRYKKLVIFPIIFCILAALAISFFSPPSYIATASIVLNGDVAFVKGLAIKEASNYTNLNASVSIDSSDTTKQISFIANGSDPASCVQAANAVMDSTVSLYKQSNSNAVIEASEANFAGVTRNNPIRFILMALLAGIAIAGCLLVAIDMIRAPIKSPKDAQRSCGYPILEGITSIERGEQLFANIQFHCNKVPSTIAIIPIGEQSTALIVSKELAAAFERGSINTKLIKGSAHIRKFKVKVPENAAVLACCEPITTGMGTAYIAHHSDTTLLCIRGWTDNKRQLETTINELRLANADIAGIAFLPEEVTVRTKQNHEYSNEERKSTETEKSSKTSKVNNEAS